MNEYVIHYSVPGGMHAGFEYYQAVPEDTMQNLNYSKTKLTMPVLTLGEDITNTKVMSFCLFIYIVWRN